MWEKLADPTHPIWKVLRLAVVGALIIVGTVFFAQNGFDTGQLMTLIMALVGLGGFDQGKAMVTKWLSDS